MEKKKKGFFKRLKNKYRMVILNDETFEEKVSMRLSRLNVVLVATFGALFLIGFTTLLIAFTPLREYIPGYASTKMRKQVIELVNKTDSLETLAKIIDQHQFILNQIISGEVPEEDFSTDVNANLGKANTVIDLSAGDQDSNFRKLVEEQERFNFNEQTERSQTLATTLFYKPVNGVVSSSFDYSKDHFGVDVAGPEKSPIMAILDGTVLESGWNPETGNVIVLQHKNDMISIYKHNAVLMKNVGEKVKAGEVIAIIGSTGTLSTSTHLHLELWVNGEPVNPEYYIHF